MNNSKQKITTFLMFQDGNAEEAMNFYISLFYDSEIVNVTRYGANEVGKEGSNACYIFIERTGVYVYRELCQA